MQELDLSPLHLFYYKVVGTYFLFFLSASDIRLLHTMTETTMMAMTVTPPTHAITIHNTIGGMPLLFCLLLPPWDGESEIKYHYK